MNAVSVLVPCYNGASYLGACLDSVVSQSGIDLEVIVADDGSTDASVDIAQGYASLDPRVKVLAATANQGMTENWNSALRAATGEFVAKLDCDDVWRPGTLRALVGAFEARPDLTASFCRTLQCDDKLEPVASYRGDRALLRAGIDPLVDASLPAASWYELCFDDVQLWHSNAFLVRRSLMQETLQGWNSHYSCASDTDLILRILEQGGDVTHLAHPGVWYRATPGSVSDTGRKQGWVALEGRIVSALSLQRSSKISSLSRHLRLQQRRMLSLIEEFQKQQSLKGNGAFPQAVATKLEPLLLSIDRMSNWELSRYRLRTTVSSLRRSWRLR